jgi:hypothetical protein
VVSRTGSIVMIAATFRDAEVAALARDRLRRYQARSEGKLRLVPPPTDTVATVVAGPIHDYDLDVVRRTVEDLGGRLAIVVPRGPQPRTPPE